MCLQHFDLLVYGVNLLRLDIHILYLLRHLPIHVLQLVPQNIIFFLQLVYLLSGNLLLYFKLTHQLLVLSGFH